MAPLDGSLPELRRQLASAWLEQGSRELRAGAQAAAAQALEQARRLSPAHPGVSILARQLAEGS
jgi:predicted TPR repeat methyltransferase